MANKDLGRRALEHAEKTNVFAPDQYGCCKKHKAINECLNKVLLNDLLWQKLHYRAIAMKDEKGFFDCIVHIVAIMVLLSFGVLLTAIRALCETLQLQNKRRSLNQNRLRCFRCCIW